MTENEVMIYNTKQGRIFFVGFEKASLMLQCSLSICIEQHKTAKKWLAYLKNMYFFMISVLKSAGFVDKMNGYFKDACQVGG
jgi:hypothetical protein